MRDHETQHTGTATAEAAEGRLVPLSDLHNHRITSGDPDVRGWEVVGSDGRTLGRVHDLLVDTGSQRVRYLDVELDRDLASGTSLREGGREPLGPEGQPMAGAETVGLADTGAQEGPGVVRTSEGVTGRLDEGIHRPDRNVVNESVGPDALSAAASGPLFSREERPITGRLDEGIARTEDRHVLIPVGLGRLTPGDDRVHLAGLRAEEAFSLPAYRHGELTPDLEADLQQRSGPGWMSGKASGDFDLYDEDRFYGGRRGGR
ncbi:MAG TPA: PRC-barrel domain-containing protein [Thermoanaerobaculia bacterium]|nr:PRC-barrel domain-containing protein [Thermoanaerobaculia bacterium]